MKRVLNRTLSLMRMPWQTLFSKKRVLQKQTRLGRTSALLEPFSPTVYKAICSPGVDEIMNKFMFPGTHLLCLRDCYSSGDDIVLCWKNWLSTAKEHLGGNCTWWKHFPTSFKFPYRTQKNPSDGGGRMQLDEVEKSLKCFFVMSNVE